MRGEGRSCVGPSVQRAKSGVQHGISLLASAGLDGEICRLLRAEVAAKHQGSWLGRCLLALPLASLLDVLVNLPAPGCRGETDTPDTTATMLAIRGSSPSG